MRRPSRPACAPCALPLALGALLGGSRAQPIGYGEVPPVSSPCLQGCSSNSPCTISGQGHKLYCIDVQGDTMDDSQKLVLRLDAPAG